MILQRYLILGGDFSVYLIILVSTLIKGNLILDFLPIQD